MIDKDTITRMAREAGLTTGDNQKHNGVYWWRSLGRPTNVSETDLQTFAQAAYQLGQEAATQRQQERIAQLEAEVGKLTTALFDCREAFPIPDQGSALESAWMGAMSEPDAVPEFVKAQVQALSLDAGRLDWLDDQNRRFRMGWRVGIAPAGNVSVGNVIELGSKAPPTTIRAAIDAATAAGKGT